MADDEDDAQKTEEPTERKLSKARGKGQVGTSQEVKNWAVLMGSALCLAILAPWMFSGLAKYSMIYIQQSYSIVLEQASLPGLFADGLWTMGLYTAPFFAVLVVASIVANLAQSGFIWAPEKIKPDLKKISLIAGVKRMFSSRTLVEFLKGIFKLTVLSAVAYGMTIHWFDDVTLMPGFDLNSVLDRLFVVCLTLTAGSLIVLTVVAIIDIMYQKYDFNKSMKMTLQEVKDEYKDTEGDPMVKARIRKVRMERAQQRMMSNVPDADVVITNPTHFAVALKYKMDDMQAPLLVAKGVDSLAFRIREVAEENDIPVVENPPLARALYAAVEIDEEIPVDHYQAVAEVIGYIMKLKGN